MNSSLISEDSEACNEHGMVFRCFSHLVPWLFRQLSMAGFSRASCAGGTWTRDAEGRQRGKVPNVNVQVQSLKGTLVSPRGCIGYDLLLHKPFL